MTPEVIPLGPGVRGSNIPILIVLFCVLHFVIMHIIIVIKRLILIVIYKRNETETNYKRLEEYLKTKNGILCCSAW